MVEFRILCIVALLAALLLSEHEACAVICPPIPKHLYVGTDSKCDAGDIQTAIGAVMCPGTIVVVTDERPYTSQALTIFNKSLALVGAAAGAGCGSPHSICDPTLGCGGGGGAPPAASITLHGDGTTSVIFVYGSSSLTLQSIELTGGGGTQGGGLLFGGTGSLTLIDSSVVNNSATNGGGI